MEHRIHRLNKDRWGQWTAVCTCGWASGPNDTATEADADGTHHIAAHNPLQHKLEIKDNG